MDAKQTLIERYTEVKRRVAEAAVRSRRRPEDIILVAVTKNAEPEQIRTLLELGHRDFGENRVQRLTQRASLVREWFERVRVLERTGDKPEGAKAGRILASGTPTGPGTLAGPARWHLIGHLQRNKVRKAVEHARLIHSIDSLRLVEDLQAQADRRDSPIDVLIQVNCSGESSKFGCPVPAALPLAEQIDTMLNVRVRGLMTMAPYCEDPEQARPVFARCFDLFEEIRTSGVVQGRFNLLSMGMTNDFEVAIEEGANVVRIGTAIFGQPQDESPDASSSQDSSGSQTEQVSA
ncbi:MAG: YggS family pyridoxal phosphate-dependent enzyme [Planctomycetota bacterium]|nr:MAG: YggS family pyridoxal phosphate-dependent enzyme [Planctomycetota bacterium]